MYHPSLQVRAAAIHACLLVEGLFVSALTAALQAVCRPHLTPSLDTLPTNRGS